MTSPKAPVPKPKRTDGVAHVFAAASYSIAGLRRLFHEAAFRHELIVGATAVVLITVLGGTVAEYLILAGLFLALIAVEAINTAIECIVDRISPDWEEYARDAKDLGSLAVMCVLLCGGLFIFHMVFSRL
jgi:diacylglycerol kinase (ATP)